MRPSPWSSLAGHRLRSCRSLVVALLAVGGLVVGNRAFHLDGLSDTVDGLAASYDPERSLAVMKGGPSGPAGVAAVVLVLTLQAAALAGLLAQPRWGRAAVLAGVGVCASRSALALCCARGVRSARPDGLGVTYSQTVSRPVAAAVWVVTAVGTRGDGRLGRAAVVAGCPGGRRGHDRRAGAPGPGDASVRRRDR